MLPQVASLVSRATLVRAEALRDRAMAARPDREAATAQVRAAAVPRARGEAVPRAMASAAALQVKAWAGPTAQVPGRRAKALAALGKRQVEHLRSTGVAPSPRAAIPAPIRPQARDTSTRTWLLPQ
jgi:hypothetical protein